MAENSLFSDNQKEIIKQYIENTFIESGPGLSINHEQVLNKVMDDPLFFSEEGFSRPELESNPEYQQFLGDYFTSGRHQQLQSYEGLQEFFQENAGIVLKDRDFSQELDGIHEESSSDYSGYHGSSNPAKKTPESRTDTIQSGPNESTEVPEDSVSGSDQGDQGDQGDQVDQGDQIDDPEDKNTVFTNEMRNKIVSDLRDTKPIENEGKSKETEGLNPDQLAALRLGELHQKFSSQVGAVGAIGTQIINVVGKTFLEFIGDSTGNVIGVLGKSARARSDKIAEESGRFPNAASASRVLDRRLEQIRNDEAKLTTMLSDLDKNPSSVDLRAGVLQGSIALSNKISRTADLAEKAGDISPLSKEKASVRLQKHSTKLKSTMEDQTIINPDKYPSLAACIKTMTDKIASVFGIGKKGAEPSPTPS
jgi:hypothetical protein